MKRRISHMCGLLLGVVLMLGIVPGIGVSAAEIETEEKGVYVIQAVEDGVVHYTYEDAENVDCEPEMIYVKPVVTYSGTDTSNLIPLGTPTDLTWGYRQISYYDELTSTWKWKEVEAPGFIRFRTASPCQNVIGVSIYRTDEESSVKHISVHYNSDLKAGVKLYESIFCKSDLESGTYYFEICQNGDDLQYCDGEKAVSEMYTYTKPDAQLGKCTNLIWDDLNTVYEGPEDMTYVAGYDIDWFFAATESEEPHSIGGSSSYHSTNGAKFVASPWDELLQRHGVGYYYYRVRALSSNIEVICNSEWSELSPAYNLTKIPQKVNEELDSIIDAGGSADSIKDSVQAMDTSKLKTAMMTDRSTVDKIAQLENAVGGAAPVEVTGAAYAFDKNKVSVIGANLNDSASGKDIKLDIDKPEKDNVIPEVYKSAVSVRFSMNLNNVDNPKDLKVPVEITLPVPSNINPDFLVVLHYHVDGTFEQLRPYIYKDGEQSYAKFVLTSFSDFALTELEPLQDGVTRIFGETRFNTAFSLADALKTKLGVEKFNTVIVASGTNFADALSGSYLANVKSAPILIINGKKPETMDMAKQYISENLADGGTVYILGGINAVPDAMQNGLGKYGVKRLAGNDRYGTNLAILKEAGVEDRDILVATGKGFADSLSASASGLPILLVGKNLKAEQKEFLNTVIGKKIVIGGTNAVSDAIMNAVGATERLGGANRFETSVMVAERFIQNPTSAVLAYASNFPDGLCGGSLAYAMNAPLILTKNGKTDEAAAYAEKCGINTGIVIGGPALISNESTNKVF